MNIALSGKAKTLFKQSIVSDIAIGFEPEIEVAHKWDLLPRYAGQGFSYLGLAIAGEFTSLDKTIRYMARHKARIVAENDKYIIVNNANDIIRAKKENKLGIGFWLQGSNPLANDLNMIDTYYQLGIRYMLLVYNTKNAIGDGVAERTDSGLSNFGIKVIEEMNRVGMIVDLSHTGYTTTMEAMAMSQDPVIFSHSNVHTINPHPRNLRDDQIKALAKTNGVIGINGLNVLLGKDSSVEQFVKHIDYISNLVGSEHVALGLDLVYFHEVLNSFYEQVGATVYPESYKTSQVLSSLQPEKIIEVVDRLVQLGYSDNSIIGILGGNFLRVAQRVWK